MNPTDINKIIEALSILLSSKGCWTNGEPEIKEEISGQFDIGLDDAQKIIVALSLLRSHRDSPGEVPVAWMADDGRVISANGKRHMEEAEHPVGIHYDIPLYRHRLACAPVKAPTVEEIAKEVCEEFGLPLLSIRAHDLRIRLSQLFP